MLIRAGQISDECSQTNIIRYSSDTQATNPNINRKLIDPKYSGRTPVRRLDPEIKNIYIANFANTVH